MAPLSRRTGPPRTNKHRDAHRQLWAASSNLPVIPRFDHGRTYRVKLTKAVTPAGHSFPLRPMQDVLISGAVADEIKAFISGAALVD